MCVMQRCGYLVTALRFTIMSTLELTVRLVAGVLLTLANGFFVATEFALTRIPQFDKEEFQASAGLRRAWKITERLEIYLTGCQLGITTTSILLGIVAEPAVTALIGPVVGLLGIAPGTTSVISVVLAVVVINLIHKIWGEQAPTYLGVEKPKAVAQVTAPVLHVWTLLTYPFILLGDGLAKRTLGLFGVTISRSWTEAEAEGEEAEVGSRTELTRKIASLLRAQDVPDDRREEVLRALQIGSLPVQEIMVPREEIIALSTTNTLEENLQIATDHMLSRFPLVEGSLDQALGTIYVPVLLRDRKALRTGEVDLEALAAPMSTVAPEDSVSDLIDQLQEEGQELALVEEDGRVVGLVTITDAFEVIAGEVRDPLDDFAQENGWIRTLESAVRSR